MEKPADTPSPVHEGAKKRVHIKSYGCQMNAHDAERMADVLALEVMRRRKTGMTPIW